jgi:hypothetical protein
MVGSTVSFVTTKGDTEEHGGSQEEEITLQWLGEIATWKTPCFILSVSNQQSKINNPQ